MEVFRYERKFIVTDQMALAIRRFAAVYLVHDEHMAGAGPDGYRVCSLYLDSPSLGLYRQSREGIKNRYKLRIRLYDDRSDGLAYLEVKKRTTETVHKLRAVVPKTAANRFLRGEQLLPADLATNGTDSLRALNEFSDLRNRLNAEGVVFADYRREAFVSKSADAVRVTFDRHVVGRRYLSDSGLVPSDEASSAVAKGVVLELKYSGKAPRWMHDLITTFSLQRVSVPKYVHCVEALNVGSRRNRPFAGSIQL